MNKIQSNFSNQKLDELMANEYNAMTLMDAPMAESHERAMEIIRSKVTEKEFLKIEEMLVASYVYAEDFGFEQGFMRGITVAKGGAA